MRFDSSGLFWDDPPPQRGQRQARPLAAIPESDWTPLHEWPSLDGVHTIALDTETYDPELRTHGPGWARNAGHVVGLSVALSPSFAFYLPIRHTVQPELNLDAHSVLQWARCELPKVRCVVGANLLYDIGWLWAEGVRFTAQTKFYDVQFAEPLLDDTARTYSLDSIAEKHLGEHKVTNELYQWAARSYGGMADGEQRKNIYRCPPCLVGPYAEADAYLPLRIINKQHPQLQEQDLMNVFDLECRLIPLLLQIRARGVRVDVDRAEQVRDELVSRAATLQEELDKRAGFQVSVNNAGDTLTRMFDDLGLVYPETAKGAPSFTAAWLKTQTAREAQLVTQIRRVEKMRSTFIEGYILNSHVDGRLHGQFHPLRSDEGGAVSGRFASSTPNLQNIPLHDPDYGPLVRSLFLPDEGYAAWRKIDYSQIEYRFLAHYAIGPGADEVRAAYNANPDVDFHDMTQALVLNETGITLERRPVKNINFGLCFGMGEPKLAATLGLELSQAKPLFAAYHQGAPFVRATFNHYADIAEQHGRIATILGRVSRFNLWAPRWYDNPVPPLPWAQAVHAYGGNIQRAMAHKGLNRLLQGSAADLMKTAMVSAWEAGVYDELGVPHLTVHDETDHSDPDPSSPAWLELLNIMQNCLKLRVPVLAGCDLGPNWGELKAA